MSELYQLMVAGSGDVTRTGAAPGAHPAAVPAGGASTTTP